jgi:hypothetical protein
MQGAASDDGSQCRATRAGTWRRRPRPGLAGAARHATCIVGQRAALRNGGFTSVLNLPILRHVRDKGALSCLAACLLPEHSVDDLQTRSNRSQLKKPRPPKPSADQDGQRRAETERPAAASTERLPRTRLQARRGEAVRDRVVAGRPRECHHLAADASAHRPLDVCLHTGRLFSRIEFRKTKSSMYLV